MVEPIIHIHGNDAHAQRKLLVRRDTGEVVNVIMWDPDAAWECPHGCELADPPSDQPVGPGWRRDRGRWVAPPDPEPPAGPEQSLADRIAALEARLAQLEGRQVQGATADPA